MFRLSAENHANLRIILFWTLGITLATVGFAVVASLMVKNPQTLFHENGFIEDFSVVVWVGSFLAGIASAITGKTRDNRWLGGWLGLLALLAGLRELDAHTWFNPATLGRFGVRYKISWWLDSSVPFLIKLFWLALFLIIFLGLCYPPITARRTGAAMLRSAAAPLGVLFLAIIFLGFGFVVDDLMRGSRLVSFQARQVLEETSELIGAALFCVAAVLHWKCGRRGGGR